MMRIIAYSIRSIVIVNTFTIFKETSGKEKKISVSFVKFILISTKLNKHFLKTC